MTADDEGAADVGPTECTMDISDYSHPNNPMLKFWDLPGVGTPRFRKDEYLEAIKVRTHNGHRSKVKRIVLWVVWSVGCL